MVAILALCRPPDLKPQSRRGAYCIEARSGFPSPLVKAIPALRFAVEAASSANHHARNSVVADHMDRRSL
jgi:hypothetical protein